MKTLATLLFAATAALSFNANADAVHGDPAIGDVFPVQNVTLQTQALNTVADTGEEVWSVAYEEYVNPADFNLNRSSTTTLASALQALDNNPPAAGSQAQSVFTWDETADEYQLQ
ncbi:hypothetical protein [sulfur-oxidizing endosymbiont of Gigantopelta aegis]|uniref:hypothetical protein n=1 Tax=sulfur-oxidizing endosymbiont of Gigantopelta aegis TaxID=2794934 RepID=UPI0018DCEE24|nr:hypothetical protein [sulfur-oxidizing endosymbiont of Gigantopelta aegis]